MSTLSLHSLFELRSCVLNGVVLLDMVAKDFGQISGELITLFVELCLVVALQQLRWQSGKGVRLCSSGL